MAPRHGTGVGPARGLDAVVWRIAMIAAPNIAPTLSVTRRLPCWSICRPIHGMASAATSELAE